MIPKDNAVAAAKTAPKNSLATNEMTEELLA